MLADCALPDAAWDAVHDSMGSAQTLLRMVMNLLDISRSEDGRLIPNLTEVDLLALVRQVRLGLEHRAARERRSLVVECSAPTEAHGGRIWVEDNHPRGSVFVLELPG